MKLVNNDIYNIASIFSQKRHYIFRGVLGILSQRLRDMGDIQAAWKLGEQILTNCTMPSGWSG